MILSKYQSFSIQQSHIINPLPWETRKWSIYIYPNEANQDPDSMALLPALIGGPSYVEVEDDVYFEKNPLGDLVNIWHHERWLPRPFKEKTVVTRNIEYKRVKLRPDLKLIKNDSPI